MSKHLSAANAHRTIAGIYAVVFTLLAALFYFTTSDSPILGAAVALVPATLIIGAHLLIARGAERCKPWARVASIILGVLLLPGIPIGTALGIWLLSNSISPWSPERKLSGSLTDGWPQAQRDGA